MKMRKITCAASGVALTRFHGCLLPHGQSSPEIGTLSRDVAKGVGTIGARKEPMDCVFRPYGGQPVHFTGRSRSMDWRSAT